MQSAGYPLSLKPNVTDAEMKDLYAKAPTDATGVSLPTIASAQEHLGLAPLEAQASGAVPIVFNSGGMPEVVVQGQTQRSAEDMRQMGKMTLELARNTHIWSSFNQAGRMWAKVLAGLQCVCEPVDQMLKGEPINTLPVYRQEMKYKPEDVTIVIPVDNSQTIDKCLHHLNETVPNTKVLVVNNGESVVESDNPNVTVIQSRESWYSGGGIRSVENVVDTPLILALNLRCFCYEQGLVGTDVGDYDQ